VVGTRNRLSRASVVVAACELLDELGPESLTMTALGQRLGVTGMALYRHVENRADLEEAVVGYVLANMFSEEDSSLPWDKGVSAWMHGVRNRMRSHPWMTRLMMRDETLSASWLAALYQLQLVLARTGLSNDNCVRELQRISRATTGITLLEIRSPIRQTNAALAAALKGLDRQQRAQWRVLAKELGRYDDDALFDDLVADTIARLRTERAHGQSSPSTRSSRPR
jgi:AcrR family transcriptional regulator